MKRAGPALRRRGRPVDETRKGTAQRITLSRCVKQQVPNMPTALRRSRIIELRQERAAAQLDGLTLPAEPTDALPGSLEKERVFQGRIAARVSLFHPDDAEYCGSVLVEKERRNLRGFCLLNFADKGGPLADVLSRRAES